MLAVSILIRRLKPGKTLDDFRAAWLPDRGFGAPTTVLLSQSLDDPQEVLTIGFTDLGDEPPDAFLARTAPQEHARHDRIDDVIESFPVKRFYRFIESHDFTRIPEVAGLGPVAVKTPAR